MNDRSGLSAAAVATQADHSALAARLELPDAVLSSTDLRTLGYSRRAIDQIWRSCNVVVLPGFTRPLVRVADFRKFLESCADRTVVR